MNNCPFQAPTKEFPVVRRLGFRRGIAFCAPPGNLRVLNRCNARMGIMMISSSLTRSFAIIGFAAVVFVTTPSRAFDMDCKLILCLAGGFPSGCGDAKSYMLDRLKRQKPPIGTCSTSASEDGEYRVPVRIFSRHYPRVCTKNVYVQEGEGNSGYQCHAWAGGYSDRLIGITIPVDTGPDYQNEFLWYRTVHRQGDK